MQTAGVKFILELIDKMSGPARKVAAQVSQIVNEIKTANSTPLIAHPRGIENLRKIRAGIDGVSSSARKARAEIASMQESFRGSAVNSRFAQVAGASALIGAGMAAFQKDMMLDEQERAIGFAAGGGQAGKGAVEFANNMAKNMALPFQSVLSGFKTFQGAMMGQGFGQDSINRMFESTSLAVKAMGLSGENAEGAFLALGQMMSKGKVSAEELRGQLGERLPGAFQIAAKSMGVSTSKLDDMMKKGDLLAKDFLPRFTEELRKTFKDALPDAMKSTQSKVFELQNSFTTLQRSLVDRFAPDITNALTALTKFTDGLDGQKVADYATKLGAMYGVMTGNYWILGASAIAWTKLNHAKNPYANEGSKYTDQAISTAVGVGENAMSFVELLRTGNLNEFLKRKFETYDRHQQRIKESDQAYQDRKFLIENPNNGQLRENVLRTIGLADKPQLNGPTMPGLSKEKLAELAALNPKMALFKETGGLGNLLSTSAINPDKISASAAQQRNITIHVGKMQVTEKMTVTQAEANAGKSQKEMEDGLLNLLVRVIGGAEQAMLTN